MRVWAGVALAGFCAVFGMGSAGAAANADELSEKAVRSFMEYAWSLTPQQFSTQDGGVVVIDKSRKDENMVPVDVARDVIMAGRLSAHAQICDLGDDQVANHRALMRRQEMLQKWTPQQMVYISQLHLTTVMMLTGRIKLVEQDGDKKVLIDETKDPRQTCTDEQRKKVKDMITAYVAASPPVKEAAKGAPAAAGGAPDSTGSVDHPATHSKAAKSAKSKAPAEDAAPAN